MPRLILTASDHARSTAVPITAVETEDSSLRKGGHFVAEQQLLVAERNSLPLRPMPVFLNVQSSRGPASGHSFSKPVSAERLFRHGPPYCGQSPAETVCDRRTIREISELEFSWQASGRKL
jgi:hypothetical protein